MKVLVVFGTRPELIKLAPVIQQLQSSSSIELRICSTGQHRELLVPLIKLFDIKIDDDLDIMEQNQELIGITTKTLNGVNKVIDEFLPDRVIVQGDTTSAVATSLAAFYKKVPVMHVEAGLRSFQRYNPWPEEVNRKMIGCVTDIHCAPTAQSVVNLRAEQVPEEEIFLTGNTIVDAIDFILAKLPTTTNVAAAQKEFPFLDGGKKLVLVTTHRRESFGKPIHEICQAIKKIAKRKDLQIIYSVHPNPNVRKAVYDVLKRCDNVYLTDPIDYLVFVYLMQQAELIVTDSGGIQEEATVVKTPVLVVREYTERVEAVASGVAQLIGVKKKEIIKAIAAALDGDLKSNLQNSTCSPYGDGKAAEKIKSILLDLC